MTRRLFLGRTADVFCLVDDEDYAWAVQWRWGVTWDRHHRKMYATRCTRLFGRLGPQTKVFLHKAILKRTGVVQPSELHTIGDHEDGDSLNNTRGNNLRWATAKENRANQFGAFAKAKRAAAEQPAGGTEIPF